MFADSSTRREEVEQKLEEWRSVMESRTLQISSKKTEYLSSKNDENWEISLQGQAVKSGDFQILGLEGQRTLESSHRKYRKEGYSETAT